MILLNNLYKTSIQTPNHLLHLTSQVNIVLGGGYILKCNQI